MDCPQCQEPVEEVFIQKTSTTTEMFRCNADKVDISDGNICDDGPEHADPTYAFLCGNCHYDLYQVECFDDEDAVALWEEQLDEEKDLDA